MRALIALALVLLAAHPVHADEREDARKAFTAGQAADKTGDHRVAIQHYLRAFELVPHQFAAYNIGADYEKLGELREASIWFSRSLELAPNAPDRDKTMRLIVDLKLRPAKLTVTSQPTNAKVYIDGQLVGVAPYEKAIRGGGHRVAVELKGERDERDVVLEFGEPKALAFKLDVPEEVPTLPSTAPGTTGSNGFLVVRGQPPGATLAIDDTVVGVIPAKVPVPLGAHKVTVTSFGYAPFETTVAVGATGEEVPVDAVLERGDSGAIAGKPPVVVQYVFGGAIGADVRGLGAIYLAEFGVRALSYDLTTRVGSAVDALSIEALLRLGYPLGRLTPQFVMGYSYIGAGLSFELGGALRIDLVKSARATVSLLAEVSVRSYSREVTDPMTMATTTETGGVVPMMVSLQFATALAKRPR